MSLTVGSRISGLRFRALVCGLLLILHFAFFGEGGGGEGAVVELCSFQRRAVSGQSPGLQASYWRPNSSKEDNHNIPCTITIHGVLFRVVRQRYLQACSRLLLLYFTPL